uniref:DDHD domain-containing protein n=1 Tax=Plectus sambesii TaxID=2011161 RepID=A0A914V2M7_9BILA
MDIMYYQSPLYRQEIVGGMTRVLNQMYDTFVEYNPDFNGQVSFFAHSLGSVMAYDILTGWSPLLLYDQFVTHMIAKHIAEAEGDNRQILEQLQDARAQIHNLEGGLEAILRSSDDRLKFKVANLFCVGSPLAVFLAMRGQEAINVIPKTEDVQRIYNIFHPADPVAYRLEPLIHADYRHIRPVKIHHFNSSKLKFPYSSLPMEMHKRSLRKISVKKGSSKKDPEMGNIVTNAEIGVDATKANEHGEREDDDDELDDDDDGSDSESTPDSSMRHHPGSGGSSPRSGTPVSDAPAPSSKRWWNFGSKNSEKSLVETAKDVVAEGAEIVKKISPLETLLEGITHDLKLERRLDYSLRQGLTEVSYWSVLKSHFTYWTHHDIIMFVLTQLYEEH